MIKNILVLLSLCSSVGMAFANDISSSKHLGDISISESTGFPKNATVGKSITATYKVKNNLPSAFPINIKATGTVSKCSCGDHLAAYGVCQFTLTITPTKIGTYHFNQNIKASINNSILSYSSQNIAATIVTLKPTPPKPTPPVTAGLNFDYATGISDTIYASSTFTYQPKFIFINQTGKPIIGLQTQLSAPQLDLTATASCNNGPYQSLDQPCTLSAFTGDKNNVNPSSGGPGVYIVKGTLSGGTVRPGSNSITLNLTYNKQGDTSKKVSTPYVKKMYGVQYHAGYMAMRFVNKTSPSLPIYIAQNSAYDGPKRMLSFAPTTGIGTPTQSTDWHHYDYKLPENNSVVYLPIGFTSGVMAVSHHPLTSTATPSENDLNTPAFAWIETTYIHDPVSSKKQRLVFDLSYVNGLSLPVNINMMGQAAPIKQAERDANYGMVDPASNPSDIMSKIETQLTRLKTPWSHLVKTDYNGKKRIESPLQIYPAPDGSFSTYYTNYINDLWIYLSTNSLYVDASSVSGTADCVLKSQMVNRELVFNDYKGNCPPITVPNKKNLPYATQQESLPIKFAKFNTCDLLTAAGSPNCHGALPHDIKKVLTLWGVNPTYRSVIGRAIAAYQAAGLLPYPGLSNGDPMNYMNQINALNHKSIQDNPEKTYSAIFTGGAYTPIPTSTPMYNVYSALLKPYFNVYTYSYGDFLGDDGTITFYNGVSSSMQDHYPAALPATIIV